MTLRCSIYAGLLALAAVPAYADLPSYDSMLAGLDVILQTCEDRVPSMQGLTGAFWSSKYLNENLSTFLLDADRTDFRAIRNGSQYKKAFERERASSQQMSGTDVASFEGKCGELKKMATAGVGK